MKLIIAIAALALSGCAGGPPSQGFQNAVNALGDFANQSGMASGYMYRQQQPVNRTVYTRCYRVGMDVRCESQ